ncbi:MAG: hypothetical protein IH987_10565 [Planctomycetes bacterium]|nr:hypothetical protein [Planctomycetota bacterium]
MYKVIAGVLGLLVGAILGTLIGVQIADATLGPSEWGMHVIPGLFIGTPLGGLVGCCLGVVIAAKMGAK